MRLSSSYNHLKKKKNESFSENPVDPLSPALSILNIWRKHNLVIHLINQIRGWENEGKKRVAQSVYATTHQSSSATTAESASLRRVR